MHVLLLLAAILLPDGFQEEIVATGLDRPMGLAFLPDGRALVTQRTGEICLVSSGGQVDTIHVVPDVLSTGEAGCSGIAIDPLWPTRPFVYIQYNMAPAQTGIAITRLTASGSLTDPAGSTLSLSQPYQVLVAPDSTDQHNGGTLRFGPDGYLYSSLGDDVIECSSQDSTSMQGVMLRLQVDLLPPGPGGPPPVQALAAPGNPWSPDTTGAVLACAMGTRNPFRFGIDPVTGYLYVADVGALEWEEIHEVRGGENLGWPWYEAREVFNTSCEGGPNTHVDWPIYEYAHTGSNSLGGCVAYRRQGGLYQFPVNYDGAILFADTFQGWMRAIEETPQGEWIPLSYAPGRPDSVNWAVGSGFVVDMVQGPEDALYYVDFIGGEVRRILYTIVSSVPGDPPVPALQAPGLHRLGSGPVRVVAPTGRGPLEVFDVQGRRVGGPVPPASPGIYSWEPGDRVPGVYFLRIGGGDGALSSRIVLVD